MTINANMITFDKPASKWDEALPVGTGHGKSNGYDKLLIGRRSL